MKSSGAKGALKPPSPGMFLRDRFLGPLGLTQKELADHIGCDIKVINRIVNEKAAVTVPIAIRLGAALGTSPEFWLGAQNALDLYRAARSIGDLPRPLPKPSEKLL